MYRSVYYTDVITYVIALLHNVAALSLVHTSTAMFFQ
jgi:hypothetical protein